MVHRDYTDNGSVQVMLFADRLEVWNPGRLPASLTLEELRFPHQSVPGNPLLANAMYLVEYIERMGTGTLDMIRRCTDAGLPEPEFEVTGSFVTRIWRKASAGQSDSPISQDRAVSEIEGKPVTTPEVAGQVAGQVARQVAGQVADEIRRMIAVFDSEHTRKELQSAMNLKSRENFENRYLKPAIEAGYVTLTIPGKPNSRFQKYRLTETGRAVIENLKTSAEEQ